MEQELVAGARAESNQALKGEINGQNRIRNHQSAKETQGCV